MARISKLLQFSHPHASLNLEAQLTPFGDLGGLFH